MKVKIKTLTALFIGGDAGDTWSPYSDYVWQDGRLTIIDNQKLEARLTREQMQDYVEKINHSIHNTRSDYALREFLREHKIPLLEITRYHLLLPDDPGRKTIKKFIRTAGRPFIPGSSLKGAVRTAFLWSWLQDAPTGQHYFRRLQQLVQKTEQRLSFQEQKDLKWELGASGLEKTALGSPQNDFFKQLQFGDCPPLEATILNVASIYRFNLKSGQAGSPLWAEVIPPEVETEFRLNLQRPDSGDAFILKAQNWSALCQMMNQFSRASLERELEKLPATEFAPVIHHYQLLRDILQQLPAGQAILRVGQGKTIFDNSLLGLLENESAFFSFRKLLELGKNPRNHKISPGEFPVTRSFLAKNQNPVQAIGWILLQGDIL